MLDVIFPSNFYILFKAPNADELNSFIESDVNEEYRWYPKWSESCNVKTYQLNSNKYLPLLQPSFEVFGTNFNNRFTIDIEDPWLNEYERGSFQEMHSHQCDFACVYFINSGSNFSQFNFYDRNNVNLSPICQTITDYQYQFKPSISAGDIIFFPGHLLHYVSPHESDVIRKTFSVNLHLNKV